MRLISTLPFVSVFVIGFSGVLLALSACEKPSPVAADIAPAFALRDSSGKIHRLEDFKGQVVLLHFWASWCPPCLVEIPKWVAAGSSFLGHPVKWVSVSVDAEWSQALRVLPSEKVGPGMVSLLDPEGSVARAYGTSKFPETYLITSEGRIAEKFVGSEDWTGPRVRFLVTKALNARK